MGYLEDQARPETLGYLVCLAEKENLGFLEFRASRVGTACLGCPAHVDLQVTDFLGKTVVRD